MTIKDYVDDAIASFAHDNADSPFQEGYLAALCWVKEMIEISEKEKSNVR